MIRFRAQFGFLVSAKIMVSVVYYRNVNMQSGKWQAAIKFDGISYATLAACH